MMGWVLAVNILDNLSVVLRIDEDKILFDISIGACCSSMVGAFGAVE